MMSATPTELALFRRFSLAKVYLLLAIYVGLLCFPLLMGKSLYWGDILLYFLPMADFQRTSFLHGQIPLWNPYVLLGQPLLGNPQMGVFYPPNAVLVLFPGWLSLSILTVFHLFLCGVFCFHFLRVQKLSELSALVGALTYAGSSTIIARLQFPPMVMVAPYLPLLLLIIDKIMGDLILPPATLEAQRHRENAEGENREGEWAASTPNAQRPTPLHLYLSVVVALMLLASHPQMAYLSLLVVVPYAVYRVRQRTGRWFDRVWLGFTGSFALGVLLCSVQLLPTLQLLRESPREQMTPEMANRFFLEARQLLTLIFPRVLGHPAFGDYKAAGNAWEPAIFVGWLPLVAAFYAVRMRKNLSVTWFWLIVSAVNLWLAFGVKAILFRVAFFLVPGVSKFHDPARYLFPLTFALVVLGAFGVETWLKAGSRSQGLKAGAILLTALPLLWSAQVWNPTANPDLLLPKPQNQNATLSNVGRVYLPNYERLWKRFVNYNDYGDASDRLLSAFRESGLPNTGMLAGTEMVHGYEPVPLSKPLAYVSLLGGLLERGEPQSRRLMEFAAVREWRGKWGSDALLPGLTSVQTLNAYKSGSVVFALQKPVRWVRSVRETHRIEGEVRTLAALSDPRFNPDETAIVSGEGSEDWASERESNPGQVLSVTRTATDWKVEVNVTDERAFFVFSQVGFPGWKVIVDGKPTDLVATDGTFSGCYVIGQNKHLITLEYKPSSYQIGLYLSLVGLGSVGGLVGYFGICAMSQKRAA